MPDEAITQPEINQLLERLRETPNLSSNQLLLLNGILKMAEEAFQFTSDLPATAFSGHFDTSFTPGKAALIMGLAASTAQSSGTSGLFYVTK